MDLVIPVRIETGTEPEFVPMLVSIKSHSSFSTKSAMDECKKMTDNLTKAFCLLVVFGWQSMPKSKTIGQKDYDDVTDLKGVSERLTDGVVAKAIFVPEGDKFGLSKAFQSMTPNAQVLGELLVSHPYIKAHGDTKSQGLNNPLKAMPSSSKIFRDLYKSLRKALIWGKPEDTNDMQT